uniref:DUF3615 domain-containing protein n=1 Tax=Arundo donax TaxID=35708 RepID=A0A0A9C6D0_ARUDO
MENPRGRLRRWPQWRSPSNPPRFWVYDITVDKGGVFHPRPNCPGGPFRTFAAAAAAIRRKHFLGPPGVVRIRVYGETIFYKGLPDPPWPQPYYFTIANGMFYVHPHGLGGPFKSLSDAIAAIELYCRQPPRIPPLPNGYYFTLKDGLFHIHPDGVGSPCAKLADALNAIQIHRDSLKPPPFDYWKDNREKVKRMQKILSELDPADFKISQKPALRKYPTEDKDANVDDLEPEICDPVLLEALEYLERVEAEREAVMNGMRWMQNEVVEAFIKSYVSSIKTKGLKYEFHKLDYQCLIFDGPKAYHHYNFTMNIKRSSKKRWAHESFFAEVKSTEDGKHYFCCQLQRNDNGHCFGCCNVGIKLMHPANGGYEEGTVDSGFPFDTDGGV